MIVVTGGAGFIGGNFVRALAGSEADVVVVDDLTDARKVSNLAGVPIADFIDKDRFADMLEWRDGLPFSPDAVIHQGACSDTMESDGRYMMQTNYEYSKTLFEYCVQKKIPFLYASSAAVYGDGEVFRESPEHEKPLNVYAFSKHLFDQYVRRRLPETSSQVAGFRYFNVYGPGEAHKGRMASVAWHFNCQLKRDGKVRLFEGSDGYADGEQRRDFVYVDDVVRVGLWFLRRSDASGVYNVGTGRSQTFNEMARAVIDWHGRGEIEYIPFPEALEGRYQSFTQADIGALRACGYAESFLSVEEGVRRYLDTLESGSR